MAREIAFIREQSKELTQVRSAGGDVVHVVTDTRNAPLDSYRFRVIIYMSESCPICHQTLQTLKSAAQRMEAYSCGVDIVEKYVEDYSSELGTDDIERLPTVRAGPLSLIGLVEVDEMERFLSASYLNQSCAMIHKSDTRK
ncbi:MAG: hypothetical protein HXY34_06710 [Candidatus Thorarchaeota archaeon]|nr:hypothetical protein [Candidatus Thorarchaeota archaeon]